MNRKLCIYLAGPMRGYKNFNFPAFDTASQRLRESGFEVFSPAEQDRKDYGPSIENNPTGDESNVTNPQCTIRNCMLTDTQWICKHADCIALLPGWESSKGAKAEHALGVALGLSILHLGAEFTQEPQQKAQPPRVDTRPFGGIGGLNS